jgi:WD40 repeat protein
MSLPYRPEAPPTDLIDRGKARLLEQLSAIVAGPDDATLPSERREGSGSGSTPSFEVRDEERYVFGEVFAAGGLGVVRRGQDRRLGRPVAIKELLRDSPQAVRRFALEAAITARLQHPGIVPLYDLGWQGQGKPFYCMQLVDGEGLDAKIAAAQELGARLRLVEHVIAVADAIAYAHERQIIHRDIKPANVLVGRFGETVVIDWGLAKDLSGTIVTALDEEQADEPAGDKSDMTEAGTVMGTLRYMSPEQARGEAVDARSDVYSLGALLYHVLAGQPPFEGGQRMELIHRVLAGELQPLAAIDPAIPSELAAIAERAMATEPEQRYASAAEFAEDLRSFQAGRMVSAHAYSVGEMLGRWVRRHRVVVGASVLTLAAITAVAVSAATQIRAERAAADEAEATATVEAERADRLAFQRGVISKAQLASEVLTLSHTPGRELEALARGVEAAADYGPEYADVPEPVIAGLSRALGGVIPVASLTPPRDSAIGLVQPSADGSRLATATWKSSGNVELQVWSLDPIRKLTAIELTEPNSEAPEIAMSPDNRLLAVGDRTRCVIVDIASGQPTLELDGCAGPMFASDGRSLFGKIPSGERALIQLYGAVAAWDLPSGTQRWSTPMPGENFVMIVHPDGQRLIVRNDQLAQERVEVLATATGERQATLVRESARPRRYVERAPAFIWSEHVALAPDGRTLAVSETDEDGRMVLWDLESETARVLELDGGFLSTPAFSGDGSWLYVGGYPIRSYNLHTHEPFSSVAMNGFTVGFEHGGLGITESHWIELPRGRTTQSMPAGRPHRVEATYDDRFVITVAEEQTRVWSTEDHLALDRWTPPQGERIMEFGGDQILTSDGAGVWRIHSRKDRSLAPVVIDPELADANDILAHAADRPSIVALATDDQGVEIHDLATGVLRCTIPLEPPPTWEPAFSSAGDVVVIGDRHGRGHIWDLEHCRERAVVRLHEPTEDHGPDFMPDAPVRFTPDQSLVVQHAGRITLVDPKGRVTHFEDEAVREGWGPSLLSPDGRVLAELRGYSTRSSFSSDGELLVFAAESRELAVVRVADGRELLRVPTGELPAFSETLHVREDLVDVINVHGELVSYPITPARLIDAACRVLNRSELAGEVVLHCADSVP